MKKYLIGLVLLFSLALAGCPKEEPPVDTPDPGTTQEQGLEGSTPEEAK